ncbi:MAG: ferritin-like domain-containing protein [Parvibaculaceae bacterium]
MGFFSKDIKTLDDLFVHTLRDIYYAEKKIEKALVNMADKASDIGLKDSFDRHRDQTGLHIERLEKVFEMHGAEAKTIGCPAIEGIIEEADEIAGDVDDDTVMDAALIAAAQTVEHYEITRYGTLVAWARELGRNDCAELLEETLVEERAADQVLTNLAESRINLKSAA